MKYVGVFCSANNPDLPQKYLQPALEFGRLSAEKGYSLVWGASDRGLMKLLADEFQKAGRQLIGITIDAYQQFARKNADEIIVAESLGDRKATMLSRSDAVVILIGGIGTLDEVTEMIELRKQGSHDKPIIVLDTEGFYDGLKTQLLRMKDEGFITKPLDELVYFARLPAEVLARLDEVRA